MHCRVEPTCGQDVRKYIREVQDAHGQMPVADAYSDTGNAEKIDYPMRWSLSPRREAVAFQRVPSDVSI